MTLASIEDVMSNLTLLCGHNLGGKSQKRSKMSMVLNPS